MTTHMTTETFLGLSIIMLGLFLSNLSAARMLKVSWRSENLDKEYIQSVAAPFFIYLAVANIPVVLSFLGLLIATVAPGYENTLPVTFGFGQFDAAALFYAFAAVTVVVGLVSGAKALKRALAVKNENEKPISIIASVYIASGAIFALLATLLVMVGAGTKVNADYVFGGSLILLGAVLAFVVNMRLAAWFKAQIAADDIDALSKGIAKPAAISAILVAVPAIAGVVVLAG